MVCPLACKGFDTFEPLACHLKFELQGQAFTSYCVSLRILLLALHICKRWEDTMKLGWVYRPSARVVFDCRNLALLDGTSDRRCAESGSLSSLSGSVFHVLQSLLRILALSLARTANTQNCRWPRRLESRQLSRLGLQEPPLLF